jgi:hypothetical protein
VIIRVISRGLTRCGDGAAKVGIFGHVNDSEFSAFSVPVSLLGISKDRK